MIINDINILFISWNVFTVFLKLLNQTFTGDQLGSFYNMLAGQRAMSLRPFVFKSIVYMI